MKFQRKRFFNSKQSARLNLNQVQFLSIFFLIHKKKYKVSTYRIFVSKTLQVSIKILAMFYIISTFHSFNLVDKEDSKDKFSFIVQFKVSCIINLHRSSLQIDDTRTNK